MGVFEDDQDPPHWVGSSNPDLRSIFLSPLRLALLAELAVAPGRPAELAERLISKASGPNLDLLPDRPAARTAYQCTTLERARLVLRTDSGHYELSGLRPT